MDGRHGRSGVASAELRRLVGDTCFPVGAPAPVPGRVGLEVERLPVRRAPDGRPAGRVPIEGPGSSTEVLDAMAAAGVLGERGEVAGIPAYALSGGGRITFEPGGALEHVTAPQATAAAALDEVEHVGVLLTQWFDRADIALASVGLDPWHPLDASPQQLRCFRYPAMHAYLASRSPDGPLMMRHTCSFQVSLDLGGPDAWQERWTVANLVAPLLTATFACSPVGAGVCGRALAWQALDPTRTGFPPGFAEGDDDPVGQMVAAALEADVLLVRSGPAAAEPGRPGLPFGRWMREGDRRYGRPTVDDLQYHLTTLFHEVRPRGMFEFRGIDAVAHRWRSVPVTFLVGALEEPETRKRLATLLAPERQRLESLWRQAATAGVRDAALCALAVETWSLALAGASRLPAGYLAPRALTAADEFLERFTMRGRAPADELRERLDAGEAASLAWASEPIAESAGATR